MPYPVAPRHNYVWAPGNNWGMGGIAQAQAVGLTGKGVKVGMMDGKYLGAGFHAPTAPLGKLNYSDHTTLPADGIDPDLAVDAVKREHGHRVSTMIAGAATGLFEGGIARGADFHWARICTAGQCGSQEASKAAQLFAAEGVEIVNLSFGGTYTAESRARAHQVWDRAFSPLYDAGALLVLAAGNEAQASAASPADMGTTITRWQERLIAVGSVQVDKGQWTTMAGFSNRCGDAALWCMVAPGFNYTGPIRDTNGDGVPDADTYSDGTSLAAPVVAATAALVKQAYRWMSAHNLQQTLLTTATDLGEPGVDPVYGWGAVNAYAAIQGPAQFAGTFSAAVGAGDDSVFFNDISGSGGLLKQGPGRLLLAGENSYTGGTAVTAGSLGLVGNLAGDLQVAAGATLEARGGRIGGDYLTAADAVTSIAIGAPLEVGGRAALDGQLHLRGTVDGYTIDAGTPERLLSAGSLSGQFDAVSYGSGLFYQADLAYAGTHLDANLTRVSGKLSAQSSGMAQAVVDGARVADQVLDGLASTAPAAPGDALGSFLGVVNSDIGEAAGTLSGFAAGEHGAQRSLAVQSALHGLDASADALHQRLSMADEGLSVWLRSDASEGDFARDGYTAMRYEQQVHHAGIDAPVGSDGLLLGLSVGAGRVTGKAGQAVARFESDLQTFSAHALQPLASGYLSAVFSASLLEVDTQRQQMLDGASHALRAGHDDRLLAARLEYGLQRAAGLNPFAALGVLQHRQGGFSEAGGNGLGLRAAADTRRTGFAELGLRLSGGDEAWTWNSTVAYRNLFSGREMGFGAAFVGLDAVDFQIEGMPLARDVIRANVGAAYRFNRQLQVFGSLGLQQASGHVDNASASAGLRLRF